MEIMEIMNVRIRYFDKRLVEDAQEISEGDRGKASRSEACAPLRLFCSGRMRARKRYRLTPDTESIRRDLHGADTALFAFPVPGRD